jgi:PAS domain S-box-containing protein
MLLMTAIEQSAEGIMITDAKGTIRYVNPAFSRVSGYSREEALGKNPRLLKSGKQDEAYYKKLWTTILGGEIWQDEIVNRRSDGGLYIEQMTITPVRNQRGEITHFIAIKAEVTERKRLEQQLRQAQKMEAVGRLQQSAHHYQWLRRASARASRHHRTAAGLCQRDQECLGPGRLPDTPASCLQPAAGVGAASSGSKRRGRQYREDAEAVNWGGY